jgi:hypothetical protein
MLEYELHVRAPPLIRYCTRGTKFVPLITLEYYLSAVDNEDSLRVCSGFTASIGLILDCPPDSNTRVSCMRN